MISFDLSDSFFLLLSILVYPIHFHLLSFENRLNIKIQETNSSKNQNLKRCLYNINIKTVKSQLSERRLSEKTGLFEDDGQSRLFSLLSIAIKLLIN